MDENHQDRTNQKSIITEDTIWLPPSYLNNKSRAVSPVPKEKGMNWGFADKSFWEWIVLLGTLLAALGAIAIPFVVTIIGLNFTQQQAQLSIAASEKQHQTDLQIAQDQQQATTLQTYIDNIQDLLLSHNLLKSKPDDDVAILARARTLTALQGLDPERKGRLVQFLYEAQLIGFQDTNYKQQNAIIDLISANLSGAYLSGSVLNGSVLSSSVLSGADLSGAGLENADLENADLSHTKLSGADLSGASLYHADLENADLSNADLSDVNLYNAFLYKVNLDGAHLTQKQLDQVYTCKDAILPTGLICNNKVFP